MVIFFMTFLYLINSSNSNTCSKFIAVLANSTEQCAEILKSEFKFSKIEEKIKQSHSFPLAFDFPTGIIKNDT